VQTFDLKATLKSDIEKLGQQIREYLGVTEPGNSNSAARPSTVGDRRSKPRTFWSLSCPA